MEIGSGSGEHGVFFQKRFPEIIWQTSDPDILNRKSIVSWIEYEKLKRPLKSHIFLILIQYLKHFGILLAIVLL